MHPAVRAPVYAVVRHPIDSSDRETLHIDIRDLDTTHSTKTGSPAVLVGTAWPYSREPCRMPRSRNLLGIISDDGFPLLVARFRNGSSSPMPWAEPRLFFNAPFRKTHHRLPRPGRYLRKVCEVWKVLFYDAFWSTAQRQFIKSLYIKRGSRSWWWIDSSIQPASSKKGRNTSTAFDINR